MDGRKVFVKSSTVPAPFISDSFISTVTNLKLEKAKSTHINIKNLPKSYLSAHSEKNSLVNFLQIYFEIMYILLVSPFKIGVDNRGNYFIKKWWLQQIACATMQFLCFIRLATEVRLSIQKESKCNGSTGIRNPVHYFNIILESCSFVYKMVTIKRFWVNQKDYLKVLHCIRMKSHFASQHSKIQSKLLLRVFLGLFIVLCVINLITGKNFISERSCWSFSIWTNQLLKLTRYTFFIDSDFSKRDASESDVSGKTFGEAIAVIVMGLCMFQRFVFGRFSDIFLLCFSITLWLPAKTFAGNILDKEGALDLHDEDLTRMGQTWPKVYSHFRAIQELSFFINEALGSQVTWYIAKAIMYYSVNMKSVLTSTNEFVIVRIDKVLFYFVTFANFIVAADISNQMEAVKVWISRGENRKSVPPDEFQIVLHEMLAKDIGIKGSNVFTITFSLIAVLLSTIVTYFIICVQQGHGHDTSGAPNPLGNLTSCD